MRLDLPVPADKPFDVVGVGFNVIDYLFRIPRFPEPDTKFDCTGATIQGGGLTATAMVACVRLGLRTRYIGKFGSDQIGRLAREELAGEGLDLAASVIADGVPNRLCIVMVEEGTGRRTIMRHVDPRTVLRPEELSREAVCSGRALHLDGYEGDAAIQAARWAREAGMPVSLDAERFTQRREELFRLTDILIVAQRYGQEVTGRSGPAEILDGLHRLGPRVVGLTRGEHGSVLSVDGQRIEASGFPVDVVDTTGAGDVFHGAFVYGVLQGWEAGPILQFANAVSALKCTRLGGRTGIPSPSEVHTFLRARGVEIPAAGLGKESPR
jgi:sugar/nucleoside kinase (ribokinase family)